MSDKYTEETEFILHLWAIDILIRKEDKAFLVAWIGQGMAFHLLCFTVSSLHPLKG